MLIQYFATLLSQYKQWQPKTKLHRLTNKVDQSKMKLEQFGSPDESQE